MHNVELRSVFCDLYSVEALPELLVLDSTCVLIDNSLLGLGLGKAEASRPGDNLSVPSWIAVAYECI
jgi:hypothetical protein